MTSAFRGRLMHGLEFAVSVHCLSNLAKIAREIEQVLAYLVGVDSGDQNIRYRV